MRHDLQSIDLSRRRGVEPGSLADVLATVVPAGCAIRDRGSRMESCIWPDSGNELGSWSVSNGSMPMLQVVFTNVLTRFVGPANALQLQTRLSADGPPCRTRTYFQRRFGCTLYLRRG